MKANPGTKECHMKK
jgi:hypothetical protein